MAGNHYYMEICYRLIRKTVRFSDSVAEQSI